MENSFDSTAIIIPMWNRTKCVKQLLENLLICDFPKNVDIPLIFSVDYNPPKSIIKLIENYIWIYGEKIIIYHTSKKGLRENILFCGNLTREYESIIILEDDLIVAPSFYNYAQQAIEFYKNEDQIAGISLYSYRNTELGYYRFEPLHDYNDVFFMKWPSSWGQVWNKSQWVKFYDWYENNKSSSFENINIHSVVRSWPNSSWKKYFCSYMADNDKYFVFPKYSFTSNPGSKGINHTGDLFKPFQVPLSIFTKNKFSFVKFCDSKVKYDQYFEFEIGNLDLIISNINSSKIELDIFGKKDLKFINTQYLISIKECKNPISTFKISEFPIENNIIKMNVGGSLSLALKNDFNSKIKKIKLAEFLNIQYKFIKIKDFDKLIIYKILINLKKRLNYFNRHQRRRN